MNKLQRINATQARNNFFNLLRKSYLEKQSFLVEKSNIPMVYIVPATSDNNIQKNQLAILKKAQKLRNSMKQTPDSVSLLRKMRRYGQ